MKGIIFNIVEEIVTDRFGNDTWDDLLADAGLDGAYTALGSYDDAQLQDLVAAASARLDQPPAGVLRMIGRAAFPLLAERYPRYPGLYASSRELLAQLDSVIHPQVLSLYPGAVVPRFTLEDRPPHGVVLRYSSARGLCHLAEGLVEGAGLAFGEQVSVVQEECRHLGGAECRIVVTYGSTDG
jgi:hypothetical protein